MKNSTLELKLIAAAIVLVAACGGSEVALKGGAYSTNLEECNRGGKTLCESITCENHFRAAAGRLSRPLPEHCKDEGAPDAKP